MTTKPKAKAPAPKPEASGPQTVLTLTPVQFGSYSYVAGLLISDVPPAVIKANPKRLSADPETVSNAVASGVDLVPYRG